MMVIRKHARQLITLADYVQTGAFSRDIHVPPPSMREEEAQKYEADAARGGESLAEFLVWAVRNKKNLLVAGGTSSGKTTLLSSLLNEIPKDERIITCEDTNEIHLTHPNIVQYEAYSVPGMPAPITIRDLIRLCLRSSRQNGVRAPEQIIALEGVNSEGDYHWRGVYSRFPSHRQAAR